MAPARGTLFSILQQYQGSEDFRGLTDSTRRSYVALIRRIENAFGDFPLSALSDRRTRGVFMASRDKIAVESGRRQADYSGRSWPACCHGQITADSLWQTRAPRAAGFTADPGSTRYGPTTMKRTSAPRRRRPAPTPHARHLDRPAPTRPIAANLESIRRHAYPAEAIYDQTQGRYSSRRTS
jgi:hypothetical protein